MDLDALYETWTNGNCKDAVEAIILNGKMSDAVEFALILDRNGREMFLKMLRNRDQ